MGLKKQLYSIQHQPYFVLQRIHSNYAYNVNLFSNTVLYCQILKITITENGERTLTVLTYSSGKCTRDSSSGNRL